MLVLVCNFAGARTYTQADGGTGYDVQFVWMGGAMNFYRKSVFDQCQGLAEGAEVRLEGMAKAGEKGSLRFSNEPRVVPNSHKGR